MHQAPDLDKLCEKIAYTFDDPSILEQALTHRSVGPRNNERLEFLGDSVLNFVIADALYTKFPDYSEGDLSRLRAHLVNGSTLASIARDLSLGDHLILGAGELRSGGFRRSSILADVIESIIGAVYRDSDFDRARKLVLDWFDSRLGDLPDVQSLKDAKTRLQELLQSKKHPVPSYSVLSVTGKSHDQTFEVECIIEDLGIRTQARGSSRRKAEQSAAEEAFTQAEVELR